MTPRIRAALSLLLVLAFCGNAKAQDARRHWWGNLNLASHHFGGQDGFLAEGERFNEFNPGIGAELQWQPRHALALGYFRNSVDENSLYALYHYTPLTLGRHVRVGAMLALVTG